MDQAHKKHSSEALYDGTKWSLFLLRIWEVADLNVVQEKSS
jgi:hypothetical protein